MPDLYAFHEPHLAVFRGLTPRPGEMEVDVVMHDGSQGLPAFGEFLLVEYNAESAVVGRVTHCYPCGPIASPQGEGYLVEVGKSGEEIPDQVRKLVLRFTLRLHLLGKLTFKPDGSRMFEGGIRRLPSVGSRVKRPGAAALSYLCNVGLEDATGKVPFGHLALGVEEKKEVEIEFDINRLKAKRTFVFARAGYGKSNLIKYLIAKLYESKPETGLLILDPEGEYAVRNGRVPGLADMPELRAKLHVYTLRTDAAYQGIKRGTTYLNFGELSGEVLVGAFAPAEKQQQVWANLIKSANREQIQQLIALLEKKKRKATDEEIGAIFEHRPRSSKEDGGGDMILQAIRNNLIPHMLRLHRTGGISAQHIKEALRKGEIVIIDTSLLATEHARAVSEILLQSLFFHNVRTFTGESESGAKKIPCIAVLEEAQTILGGQHFSDSSIFVRWVKEGRKYDLGSIMITQQPGAISTQILSQGDNFFVMHLLNQGDLDALRMVNGHYSDDLLLQLRTEPIKGNCYFWSAPDQPYVICARVKNFDDVVGGPPVAALESNEVPQPTEPLLPAEPIPAAIPIATAHQTPLQHVLEQIATHHRVYVFTMPDTPELAVSVYWLRRQCNLPEPAFAEAGKQLGVRVIQARLDRSRPDHIEDAWVFAADRVTLAAGKSPKRLSSSEVAQNAAPAAPPL